MITQRMDIEIVLDEYSRGSVKLNGEEVGGRVRSVQLFGTAQDATYVVLKVWPTSVKMTAPQAEVETEEITPPVIGS